MLQVHKLVQCSCYRKKKKNKLKREESAGREGVIVYCTYKLFKLYKMHVGHTCLSIYDVWIYLLFIENVFFKTNKQKKNV